MYQNFESPYFKATCERVAEEIQADKNMTYDGVLGQSRAEFYRYVSLLNAVYHAFLETPKLRRWIYGNNFYVPSGAML